MTAHDSACRSLTAVWVCVCARARMCVNLCVKVPANTLLIQFVRWFS
jgi:hypothetical protein